MFMYYCFHVVFFAKNLHTSKESSNFALEIINQIYGVMRKQQ